MIELLEEQLKEYLLEYEKVNDEMKSLFEKEKFKPEGLRELSKKGAGLKMMITACVREVKFCSCGLESTNVSLKNKVYE